MDNNKIHLNKHLYNLKVVETNVLHHFSCQELIHFVWALFYI